MRYQVNFLLPLKLQKIYYFGLCRKILLANQFAGFFTFDLFELLILIPGVHCYIVLVFERPRVAIFADILKIVTMFVKTILKYSKKVKRFRNYVLKCNLYQYFLIQQNLLIFDEKNADISTTQRVYHVIYIFFGSLGRL